MACVRNLDAWIRSHYVPFWQRLRTESDYVNSKHMLTVSVRSKHAQQIYESNKRATYDYTVEKKIEMEEESCGAAPRIPVKLHYDAETIAESVSRLGDFTSRGSDCSGEPKLVLRI
uniref:Bestrophin homolog n=1 Tax=Steinernema glaseri TaxID=37863 RepID=A0A1I7YVK9_9BILA